MKIILITSGLEKNNGWGRYSLDIANHLKKNGVEVVVVCSKANDQIGIAQHEILPNPLSFKKIYLSPLYLLPKFYRLRKEITGVTSVHCLVEPYVWIGYLITKILRVKNFLITIHGSYGIKMLSNPIYSFFQKFSYRRAKKIICVSEYTRRKMSTVVANLNFAVIPNGIDESSIINSPKTNFNHNIVSIGEVKWRKGYHKSVEVIKFLLPNINDIKYSIIGRKGDKAYGAELSRYIKDNNLGDKIMFIENADEKEKENYLNDSSIFMLLPVSGKYDFEGFGLVYLEASAKGIPTVGSIDSGAADAIKDSVSGYLVDPDNPKDIAGKIIGLLNDRDLYRKFSAGGIDWAKQSSWTNRIKEYIALYH